MNNYRKINHKLLIRYKKYLNNKLIDLQVKAIGSYWTKYKWTKKDQNNWELIYDKIKKINKVLY